MLGSSAGCSLHRFSLQDGDCRRSTISRLQGELPKIFGSLRGWLLDAAGSLVPALSFEQWLLAITQWVKSRPYVRTEHLLQGCLVITQLSPVSVGVKSSRHRHVTAPARAELRFTNI